MTGSKLWHKNTEIKNTKVAKMLELIKTCHQYPFCWGENRFSQYAVRVKWVISYCLEESLAWRNKQKWRDSIFLFTNVSSSYLNTINLKLFHVSWQDSGNAGYLWEWYKNKFLEKHPWQNTNSGKMSIHDSMSMPATMVGGIYAQVWEKLWKICWRYREFRSP